VYGAVKQRLARDIGKQLALDFYRETLTSLIQRLQAGPWELHLSVATKGDEQDPLFQGMPVTVQPEGDLGFRMQSELGQFNGSNRIIIGSDIPEIEVSHLQEAFDSLARHDLLATLPVGSSFAKVATLADVDDGDAYRKFIDASGSGKA